MIVVPNAPRFPLLVRLVIRVGLLIFWFFVIGFVSAAAKHFLVLHYDIISEETLTLYRGGINMLLVLWFMGLLSSERDAAIAMEARQGGNNEDWSHPKDDSAGPKDIAR